MSVPSLILASGSAYRRELLARLRIPFIAVSPSVDESRLHNEPPDRLVTRLSEAKTRALESEYPDSVIIGSDQVAVLNGQILGKPGNRTNAIAQLQQCINRTVSFYTGLCVLNATNNKAEVCFEIFEVKFRNLTERQIEHYIDIDQPFDSAGSFKAESLGIALFEHMRGDDPSSLIGLPLIRLTEMLNRANIAIL